MLLISEIADNIFSVAGEGELVLPGPILDGRATSPSCGHRRLGPTGDIETAEAERVLKRHLPQVRV